MVAGAEHFKYKDHDKSADYEIMSTSSLRRKLFSCDTTPPVSPVGDVTPPISPVKGPAPVDSSRESMPFIISSPPISPIRAVEDVQSMEPDRSVMKTPSSAQVISIIVNCHPDQGFESNLPKEMVRWYMCSPRKLKGGICCGGHLAITYGEELLYRTTRFFCCYARQAILFRVTCFFRVDFAPKGYATKSGGAVNSPPYMTLKMAAVP